MSQSPKKTLRQPGLLVYACGVATSVLALWGVHLLLEEDVNVMGWYLYFVIPVGALLVGIASGLGYGLGSRYLNVKLSHAFAFGMIATGLVDYVAAQYLTYQYVLETNHVAAESYSFVQYIRDMCEGMAFSARNSGDPSTPLGVLGYLFKFLEMVGYALGTMIPSGVVLGMTYCKKCQFYLKPHLTAHLHSPEQWKNLKKLDKPQRLAALQQSIQDVIARAQAVADEILDTPLTPTVATLTKLDSKIKKGTAARADFEMKKCPGCDAHEITLTLFNMTIDNKGHQSLLLTVNKTKAENGSAEGIDQIGITPPVGGA
jgi:hypothetical protein